METHLQLGLCPIFKELYDTDSGLRRTVSSMGHSLNNGIKVSQWPTQAKPGFRSEHFIKLKH